MPLEIARWLPEFPVRDNCLYLNHAAVAPLPRRVADAMRARLDDMQSWGSHNWERWQETELGTRSLAAELVGCRPEDISLIRSTSEGISIIAQGLGLKKGDVVLVAEEDFPSNVAPYLALQSRGVVVRRYPNPRGRINPDEVALMLGPKVKAVAVSWVAFHTGWVAPVAELAQAAHRVGAVLILDAIQGLGALADRFDDLGADAMVADGHKWLLAPEGLGIMATRPELRARLQPVLAGWLNVCREGHDMFLRELVFHTDGRRFEPGAMPNVLLAGLHAAIDLLVEAGMDNVEERVTAHNRALTRNLLEVGWQVGSPGSANPVAGIVAAKHPFLPAHEAAKRLRERHIEVTARQGWVRFSPHFYATAGEIDALRVILGKL